MKRVTLTSYEVYMLTWVGELRYQDALDNDRKADHPQDGAWRHIQGALAEFAASIALNLYWRPNIGITGQPDLGGLVEVRSTDLPKGHLIVPTNGKGPYVLVKILDRFNYEIVGWIDAAAAICAFPVNADHGTAGHWVPQSGGWLRPLSELDRRLYDEKAFEIQDS